MAYTQQSPSSKKATTSGFGLEDRKAYYESSKLNHSDAVLRSLLLPGLGNFYTEQDFTGAIFMGTFGMGLFTLLYGLTRRETINNEWTYLGAGVVIASYGGAVITSYMSVDDYNDDLRRRYQLKEEDVATIFKGNLGLSVALKF